MNPILNVSRLTTSIGNESGRFKVVDDVSFSLNKGATLGVVGESGCGKSMTSLSIMRLLPKPFGRIESGRIELNGQNILDLPVEKMHQIRGKQISMIFQEPMTALNPVHKIGKQIGEAYSLHFPDMQKRQIQRRTVEMLHKVGIPAPEKRVREYPHQVSGGMRQRIMIAGALACNPEILIADEPTTALDVTIQAQILDLIKSIQIESGMSVIFITHDLGVIAEMCDQAAVMYAGKLVEKADVKELFRNPAHPYTKGLIESIPRLDSQRKTRLSVISGTPPDMGETWEGCRFKNRCGYSRPVCEQASPEARHIGKNHFVSCHLASAQDSVLNGELRQSR